MAFPWISLAGRPVLVHIPAAELSWLRGGGRGGGGAGTFCMREQWVANYSIELGLCLLCGHTKALNLRQPRFWVAPI